MHQLRYAIAVAEESNFTRAAARCFVVQSALSHQIKALEAELGVALFARTSRRVELTAAGRAFLPAARAALSAAARAAQEATAAAGEVRGELDLGIIPTVAAVDIPAVLARFRGAHPQVRIRLHVSGSDDQLTAIAAGQLDVGLLGLQAGRTPHKVAWRDLGQDRHVAVVGADHRLAPRDQVSMADLADESFADFPAGTPGRAQSDQWFAAAGLHREVAFEAMDTDLLLAMVGRGLAITLLPSRFVRSRHRTVNLPILDGPGRGEYVAWSAFNASPLARAFLAELERDLPG